VKLTRRKSFLINLGLMPGSFVCCLAGLETAAWLWERGQAQGPYAWEPVASRCIRLDRFETSSTGYTLMHPSALGHRLVAERILGEPIWFGEIEPMGGSGGGSQ